MSKILSAEECDNIERVLRLFNEDIEQFCVETEDAINKFNTSEIVQSFYASGKLGKGMEEELIKIKQEVEKYNEILTGNLIPVTRQVVAEQKTMLNQTYQGGK